LYYLDQPGKYNSIFKEQAGRTGFRGQVYGSLVEQFGPGDRFEGDYSHEQGRLDLLASDLREMGRRKRKNGTSRIPKAVEKEVKKIVEGGKRFQPRGFQTRGKPDGRIKKFGVALNRRPLSFKRQGLVQVAAATGYAGGSKKPSFGKFMKDTDVQWGEIDFGSINVTTSNIDGDILIGPQFITPSIVAGSRMATMAALWEQWRCTEFALVFYPTTSSTDRVQILLYIDPDADDTMTAGADLSRRIRQSQYVRDINCSTVGVNPVILPFHQNKKQTTLFVGDHDTSDPHWNSCGIWGVICGNTSNVTASVGRLAIRFRYHFFVPTLETSVLAISSFTAKINGALAAIPLGTSFTVVSASGLNVAWDSGTNFSITGGIGDFIVACTWSTSTAFTPTVQTMCSAITAGGTLTANNWLGTSQDGKNGVGVCGFTITTNNAVIVTLNQVTLINGFSNTNSRFYVTRVGDAFRKRTPAFMRKAPDIDQLMERLALLEETIAHGKDEVDDYEVATKALLREQVALKLSRCVFCGMDPPDHIGRECPKRLAAVARGNKTPPSFC
jgi:hypothetical protein